MLKETHSAQVCVVGPGAAGTIGAHAARFGTRALVIGGTRGVGSVRAALWAGLQDAGVAARVEQGGHVRKTRPAVDALVAAAGQSRAAVVIACGGGAVMDCGKAVAFEAGLPLINVPTTAGTNACGTAGARIEGDTGQRRYRGAAVIVADTDVIARAGERSLASGMADALPTWYGAQHLLAQGGTGLGAARQAMARACNETILAAGASAYQAAREGTPTPELDAAVEAIVYCSGVAGTGIPGTHDLHPAFMAACRRETIHGEWVAFGLLVRLVLGGEFSDDVPRLLVFCRSVGLPTRFAEFGLDDPPRDTLLAEAARIAAAGGERGFGTGRRLTPEVVVEAMEAVDRLGREAAGSALPTG